MTLPTGVNLQQVRISVDGEDAILAEIDGNLFDAFLVGLGEGLHQVSATAILANHPDVTVVVNVLVDLTPPQLIVDSVPTFNSEDTLSVSFTATDTLAGVDVVQTGASFQGFEGVTIFSILNGEGFTQFLDLPNGDGELIVEATDNAGNVTYVALPLVVDHAPPELTFISPSQNYVFDEANGVLIVNVLEPHFSGNLILLGNGVPMNTYIFRDHENWVISFDPLQVAEGAAQMVVRATDTFGNLTDSNPLYVTITHPIGASAITVVSPTTASASAGLMGVVHVVLSSDVPLGEIQLFINGILNQSFPVTPTAAAVEVLVDTHVLSNSTYVVQFKGLAEAKSILSSATPQSWLIDNDAPTGTMVNPQDSDKVLWPLAALSFELKDNEDGSGLLTESIRLVINGVDAVSEAFAFSPSIGLWLYSPSSELVSGAYTLSLSFQDIAGNESLLTGTFTLTQSMPVLAGVQPLGGQVILVGEDASGYRLFDGFEEPIGATLTGSMVVVTDSGNGTVSTHSLDGRTAFNSHEFGINLFAPIILDGYLWVADMESEGVIYRVPLVDLSGSISIQTAAVRPTHMAVLSGSDGIVITSSGTGSVVFVDANGEVLGTSRPLGDISSAEAFTNGGSVYAINGESGLIEEWSPSSGVKNATIYGGINPVVIRRRTPESSELVVLDEGGWMLRVVDVIQQGTVLEAALPFLPGQLNLSADGLWAVVSAQEEERFAIINLQTAEVIAR